jgi:hypothetical protein
MISIANVQAFAIVNNYRACGGCVSAQWIYIGNMSVIDGKSHPQESNEY